MYSTGLFLLHHRVLLPLNVTRWNALCVKGFIRKYLFASQEKDIYLFYTFYITLIRGQGAPMVASQKGIRRKTACGRQMGEANWGRNFSASRGGGPMQLHHERRFRYLNEMKESM